MRNRIASCVFVLLCALAHCAYAQAGCAELFGTVTDPLNLPLADVRIELKELSTQVVYTAISSPAGRYHLSALPPGTYLLTAEYTAFKGFRRAGLQLRVADRISIDITRELGGRSESVEVTAAAPLLQSATGSVSHVVDRRKTVTVHSNHQ